MHEGCVATGFVQFVYVGALEVFDELQFEALGIGELADCSGNGFALREL